jgi:RsiW-degrading membrane proteinase PrsW (M82 family)
MPPGPRRQAAFAANPHEHVYHPAIVSTFFPHLGPQRMLQVRWLVLVGVVAAFLIGLGRVVPVAIVVAALLIPLLYLLYFYDAAIYEDEPLSVLAATFAAGIILGTGMSLIFAPVILRLERAVFAPRPQYVLLTGVGLPLLAQALMLVGPVLLYFLRPRFDEVLDGLAFGAASALGFAAAQSIGYSWLLIVGPILRGGPAFSWALPTIRISVLQPLVYAATTGLICAALWARRAPRSEARALGWIASLPVAVVISALGQMVPALGSVLLGGQILNLVWYAAALLVLVLLLRHVLHVSLITRARALGHGGRMHCPHCFHEAPDLPFCPHCGLALRASAKGSRRPLPSEETHA